MRLLIVFIAVFCLAASPPLPVPTVSTIKATYTINFTWDTVSGITNYGFYRGTASHIYTSEVILSTNFFTVTNLARTNIYYFVVTSRDTNGLESDFSNEVSWPVPITNYYALYPQVGTTLTNFSDLSTNPFVRWTNVFLTKPQEYYRIRVAVTNSPL